MLKRISAVAGLAGMLAVAVGVPWLAYDWLGAAGALIVGGAVLYVFGEALGGLSDKL
jgi:hypothetical protein